MAGFSKWDIGCCCGGGGGGGTIATNCCVNLLPTTLYVTFSNPGTCAAVDGQTFPILWVSGSTWDSTFSNQCTPFPSFPTSHQDLRIRLVCLQDFLPPFAYMWTITVDTQVSGTPFNTLSSNQRTFTCSPLSITFTSNSGNIGGAGFGCCVGGGAIGMTVTE